MVTAASPAGAQVQRSPEVDRAQATDRVPAGGRGAPCSSGATCCSGTCIDNLCGCRNDADCTLDGGRPERMCQTGVCCIKAGGSCTGTGLNCCSTGTCDGTCG